MKRWPYIIAAMGIAAALLLYSLSENFAGKTIDVLDGAAWQRMVSPGPLSRTHSFLEQDCAACHTAVKGPEANNCIACHATNEALLATQTTAFHATVSDCRNCHVEHMGIEQRPIAMDHMVLFKLGDGFAPADKQVLLNRRPVHSHITVQEAALNCSTCHSNQDPHRTFFGTDCASCHSTTLWSISEFRHSSAQSTDCAQCHQAPPSHFMEHFEMVSMKVAGVEHADVSQCFLCHQNNNWNDIKGVGWYKHH